MATMCILAGFWNEVIDVDKNKKPKTLDWKSCVKMMGNPLDFMNKLMNFKETVDANLVPNSNMNFVKSNYLGLDYFNSTVMK
jgi:hypothetical protein